MAGVKLIISTAIAVLVLGKCVSAQSSNSDTNTTMTEGSGTTTLAPGNTTDTTNGTIAEDSTTDAATADTTENTPDMNNETSINSFTIPSSQTMSMRHNITSTMAPTPISAISSLILSSTSAPSLPTHPQSTSTPSQLTSSTLSQSTPTVPLTTISTAPMVMRETPWVWVGVAGALLLVLLIVAGVLAICVLCKLCCSKQKRSPVPRKISSSSSKKLMECALEEIPDDKKSNSEEYLFEHLVTAQLSSFPVSSLPSYVEQLHDEDSYLAEEEYDDVRCLDPPAASICKQAKLSCNDTRNRYTNILPRDSTRVVLSQIPKVAGSDYINANFIDGFSRPREYIATQGPLPSTCPDFWRMIWEQNIQIIVMVTSTEENGIVKCQQYWPPRGTVQYGNTTVCLESQVLFPEFVVRELTITAAAKGKKNAQVAAQKTVTQYHFTSWPDFGVPREASTMIKFVRRIRRGLKASSGPILTHCSAGVGRTGTYIAVDMLTQQLDAGGPVNVQEVVCKMRAQRAHMVQTAAQYMFIYDSTLYYHLYGEMEVTGDGLGAYVDALDTPTDSGETPLDKEFQYVMSTHMSPDCLYSVALDDANKDMNRDSSNVPFDNNRVVLEDLSSGHDYINASFITGYYNRIEFIATQHPLQSTAGDFWSMVWDRTIKTIVTIGPLTDKEDSYWPAVSSEPRTFDGGVSVCLVDSEWVDEAGLCIRELSVHSVENTKETLPVTQFHLHSWPVGGAPSETTPTMELIARSREHWKESGFNLILVHTTAGISSEATGVYCALCVLLRQLDIEDCVDVFSAVRKLRKQRPAILTSKDYYKFIYQVLAGQQKDI